MQYEITIRRVFSAAHAIRLSNGALEPLHGHDWVVDVAVGAARLDKLEMVVDFHKLERAVDSVVARVHNYNLNDLPPFAGKKKGMLRINTTAERVAWWVAQTVAQELPRGVQLTCVSVEEAPGCVATYRPGRGGR